MASDLTAERTLKISESLSGRIQTAVNRTLKTFETKQLRANQFAMTVVDLTNAIAPRWASYRGDTRIYPASVIKLFYLHALHRWLEDGKICDSPECRRARRDMIVDSSNDATHYLIDLITGTTGGPELPPDEMAEWSEKRNVINRYFHSVGFRNININQKPWGDGPYGRERVFLGEEFENRNMLTTDATARLLTGIVLRQSVTPERSLEMLNLLARDRSATSTEPNDQARQFTGPALPTESKLWSKAGWTRETRHDAAYFELADGKKLVVVTFTVGQANQKDLISSLVREFLISSDFA